MQSNRIPSLVLLCLFASVDPLHAETIDRKRLETIPALVENAIRRGDCPGAVVLVVHRDQVVYRRAFGLRSKTPEPVRMTEDTVFDLASLTKPIATGTSIMLLIEQGKLRPSDKISKYWPAFGVNGKEDVTVEHCLLHVSGLIPDNSIKDYTGSREEMLARIAGLKLESPPGTRFRYSDVGFIVLGELVEMISGKKLNRFAEEHVFQPLKMAQTGYPARGSKLPFAPTSKRDGKMIVGEVHDPRAFALGGVAGHAGLFGSADDLGRYCRMLLRSGELDGARILSPLGVQRFTEPHPVLPRGSRSYGWDVDTSYSAQRGVLFPAGEGFGHTGFTGTSIWIDPLSQTAIILLTSRLHPDEKGNVTELRRQIGTTVASAIIDPDRLPRAAPKIPSSPASATATKITPVLTGIDVLRKEGFKRLEGCKVGIVTNHTGRAFDGTPTIDLIVNAKGVKVLALFSPEHGIRGEKDEKVADGKDEKTGLPVYSLYGDRRAPTPESLEGIDTLVYDIQDIGCRFYTYISTLGLVMETAKKKNIRIIVLDRPNPIGGIKVEGPVRDAGREAFVAFHSLPLRHGMTVGELAAMFNFERKLDAKLEIINCVGWSRADTYDRTALPWRNPSPNMRHLTAAMLYPGVGILETTNISVGRGTERPFEWIGAPWIDGRKLAIDLNRQNIPGVRFLPVTRVPSYSVHKDKECHGVDLIVDDWDALRPVHLGITLATTLRRLYPKEWDTKRLDTLLIHKSTLASILAGKSATEIENDWSNELAEFKVRRAKYLRYDN